MQCAKVRRKNARTPQLHRLRASSKRHPWRLYFGLRPLPIIDLSASTRQTHPVSCLDVPSERHDSQPLPPNCLEYLPCAKTGSDPAPTMNRQGTILHHSRRRCLLTMSGLACQHLVARLQFKRSFPGPNPYHVCAADCTPPEALEMGVDRGGQVVALGRKTWR